MAMVQDTDIRTAVGVLFRTQGLQVEPSSAVPVAWLQKELLQLTEPVCVVLTGENIAREDFYKMIEK